MSDNKNRVILVGNLGADPEIRITATGKKMARFQLATNESYQNSQGEKVTETQWHQLVAWGKVADKAELELQKGAEVSVEGKLVHRSYVDKDGAKKYISEINVFDIILLQDRSRTEA
jgi:single-strand DNA-binding protein